MDFTGELAIHPIGSKQNVHRPGTEMEMLQSGAATAGLSRDSSKRVSTSVVLDSLRRISDRIENTKRRRLVIEATDSVKSTYSSCDRSSADQLSTIPDSRTRIEYNISTPSSVVDRGSTLSVNSSISIVPVLKGKN